MYIFKFYVGSYGSGLEYVCQMRGGVRQMLLNFAVL